MMKHRRRKFGALAVGVMAIVAVTSLAAQSPRPKPPVPPGAPARGFAVALLTTGIDYTRPEIARRLARDGEGDLIGFDTVDQDRRPYASDEAASRLAALSPALILPIRIDPERADSMAAAFAFLKRTPARVVVVPLPLKPTASEALANAMAEAPEVVFLLAAGDDGLDLDAGSVPPHLVRRDNTLIVSALAPREATTRPNSGAKTVDVVLVPATAARERPGGGSDAPVTSAEAAVLMAGAFACAAADLARAASPAEVKRVLLARGRRDPRSAVMLMDVCDPRAPRR